MDKAVALQFRQLNITCSSNISRKTELGERQAIEWTRESTDWRTSTNLVIYKLHDSDVRSRVKFLPSSWTARELWEKKQGHKCKEYTVDRFNWTSEKRISAKDPAKILQMGATSRFFQIVLIFKSTETNCKNTFNKKQQIHERQWA